MKAKKEVKKIFGKYQEGGKIKNNKQRESDSLDYKRAEYKFYKESSDAVKSNDDLFFKKNQRGDSLEKDMRSKQKAFEDKYGCKPYEKSCRPANYVPPNPDEIKKSKGGKVTAKNKKK